jgi:hypothetical protein
MDINWYMRQQLVNEHQRALLVAADNRRAVRQAHGGRRLWFSRRATEGHDISMGTVPITHRRPVTTNALTPCP